MESVSIGWIGLGKMGIPMSGQLIRAGYPLSVYNRSKEKEASLRALGAGIAASPAELMKNCEMIILMVSDDQAVRDVFSGETGLLNGEGKGRTILNMSTVSASVSREFAARCRELGHDYLDCPVSGSVKQAEEAQLVIMAGGREETFLKAKPVLEKMGKMAMLVGDTGAGNIAKLAINSLLSLHALGLAESAVFARQNGIKLTDLFTLLNNGALSNIFMKIKGDAILNDNYQPAFILSHIVKDLRLANEQGAHFPLAEAAFATYQKAEKKFGNEDLIAVIKQLREEDPAS